MLSPADKGSMTQMAAVTMAVVLCATLRTTVAASNKTKLCFNGTEVDQTRNITLTCPDGQVISIEEALFGRSKWGVCIISDDDCVEKTRIFQECQNQNNCTRSFKTYSTTCGYATVMFISYDCLQVGSPTTYFTPVDPVSTYTTSATTPNFKKTDTPRGSHIYETAKPSRIASGNSGTRMSEAGIIAGCVVAAVVTVIALVIAITMVVRRLLQKSSPDEEDEDDDDKDSSQSKSFTHCLCITCFTTSQSAHQHRLEATKMTSPSSEKLKQDKNQTCANNDMASESEQNSVTGIVAAKRLQSLTHRCINFLKAWIPSRNKTRHRKHKCVYSFLSKGL